MKPLLTFSLILLSLSSFSQTAMERVTGLTEWDSTKIGVIHSSMGMIDKHGKTIATKEDTGRWVIVDPDAFMKYHYDAIEDDQARYYKLVDKYNRLIKDFNRLRGVYIERITADKRLFEDLHQALKPGK